MTPTLTGSVIQFKRVERIEVSPQQVSGVGVYARRVVVQRRFDHLSVPKAMSVNSVCGI
jgi:hypothetical protein